MSTVLCPTTAEIPRGCFLADCAVSGGNLAECLAGFLRASGGRLCLRLAPVYMDFALPCPEGTGTALTLEALRGLYQGQKCHFSQALCTEYFSYVRQEQAHVVLFDSLESLRRKAQMARSCGVPALLVEDPQLRRALEDCEKSTPPRWGAKTHIEKNQ